MKLFETSWRGLMRACFGGLWDGLTLFAPGALVGFLASFAILSCAGCPPTPPPGAVDAGRPTYDGNDLCTHVCSHLADLQCKEGLDPTCVDTCRDADEHRRTNLHEDCLLDAGTKEAVRGCGPVLCP